MGLFGGGSKNTTLLQGFYKAAFENKKMDELCAVEAGANVSDILRDSDFYILYINIRMFFYPLCFTVASSPSSLRVTVNHLYSHNG